MHREHETHTENSAEAVGIAWWNRLTKAQRRYWLDIAGSARPVDAFRAYQRRDDEKPLARAPRGTLAIILGGPAKDGDVGGNPRITAGTLYALAEGANSCEGG